MGSICSLLINTVEGGNGNSVIFASSMSRIRNVRMSDLDEIARRLASQVLASGFLPDRVVYLERGARLLAVRLAAQTGWPLIPLLVQRPSTGMKRRLAATLRRLPRRVVDGMRTFEQRWCFARRGPREVVPYDMEADLSGKRILILDDAADSGSSVLAARSWAAQQGAEYVHTKVAVISATTAIGRSVVDYSLFDANCRFPWSSDSDEYAAFEAEYASLGEDVRKLRRP